MLRLLPFSRLLASTSLRSFSRVPIILGDLGEGTKEATVKTWFLKEGAQVQEYDDLCEVFTDKLVAPISSTVTGTLVRILQQEDSICKVGNPLCQIDTSGENPDPPTILDTSSDEDVPAKSSASTSSQFKSTSQQSPIEAADSKFLATPATRHLIKKHKLDPSKIKPTGKGNRILKEDVLRYIEQGETPSSQAAPQVVQQQAPATVSTLKLSEGDQVKKLVGVKRGMVKTMTSALSIPTFTYSDQFEMQGLLDLRKKVNEKLKDDRVSIMTFLIKAFSLALKEYPEINALQSGAVDDQGYIFDYVVKRQHNFSVAVDSPMGLIVPVIKGVDSMSIVQISKELKRLVEATKAGKLTNADFEDGTFTLSNIGVVGGTYTVPTILRPQTCIVGIGKVQRVVRVDKNDEIYKSSIMNVSFTADHRVHDGATVARFSERVRHYLEDPNLMLINLN